MHHIRFIANAKAPLKAVLLLLAATALLAGLAHLTGLLPLTLKSPGTDLLTFAEAHITWYNLLLFVGIIAAWAFALKRARELGWELKIILKASLYVLIGGELGARLYYVAICFPYYVEHLHEIFDLAQRGLSIHGCILGIILSLVLFCRVHKIPILPYLDLIAMVLPLAQAIWRWGNFFNSECFGQPLPDSALLKLYIPPASRPAQFADFSYFHATFLYEAVWDFAAFLVLYFILGNRLKQGPGLLSCIFLVQYAICRLIIEPIRVDGITYGPINVPIAASLVCLLTGTLGLYILWIRHGQRRSGNNR